jgi:hypothetical protein
MFKETFDLIDRGTLELTDKASYPFELRPHGDEHTRNNHMLFHFSMWLSFHPEVTDFRVIIDCKSIEYPIGSFHAHPQWIIFGNRRDRTVFKNWLKTYEKWFGEKGLEASFFPESPASGRYSLSFLAHPIGAKLSYVTLNMEYPADAIEKWTWVLHNCKKPVYSMPNGLAFSSMHDAMLFKLRW